MPAFDEEEDVSEEAPEGADELEEFGESESDDDL